MVEAIWIYPVVGALAGLLAGLFGVGGGLVIVPALLWAFHAQAFAQAMHLAIGTSLATIVVTGLSSVWAHHKRGAVDWTLVASLAPGLVLGSLLGAVVADQLPSDGLRRLFGVFECLIGLQMLLATRYQPRFSLPGKAAFVGAGVVIGLLSALLGIGGGTLTVPLLVWVSVAMTTAVATSAACGLPIALAGALGFVVMGWNEAALPDFSTGYLYWPAWLGISMVSVVFAPLGARLAHALPTRRLKRGFALLLLLVGGRMLWP